MEGGVCDVHTKHLNVRTTEPVHIGGAVWPQSHRQCSSGNELRTSVVEALWLEGMSRNIAESCSDLRTWLTCQLLTMTAALKIMLLFREKKDLFNKCCLSFTTSASR